MQPVHTKISPQIMGSPIIISTICYLVSIYFEIFSIHDDLFVHLKERQYLEKSEPLEALKSAK
jgi:hypothetical protein